MSMELYVASENAILPDASRASEYLRAEGINLEPHAFQWPSQSGFLPMKLEGSDAGVEVDLWVGEDGADVLSQFGLTANNGAGGKILDPEEGAELSPADALDEARDCIKGLG